MIGVVFAVFVVVLKEKYWPRKRQTATPFFMLEQPLASAEGELEQFAFGNRTRRQGQGCGLERSKIATGGVQLQARTKWQGGAASLTFLLLAC